MNKFPLDELSKTKQSLQASNLPKPLMISKLNNSIIPMNTSAQSDE